MAMLVTDPRKPDNPVVFLNAAFTELTGYPADEVLGRNCRFLQGPDTDRDAVARVRDLLAVDGLVEAELLNYRRDGSPFWNRMFITPVLGVSGQPLFYLATEVDVTEARTSRSIESTLRTRQRDLDEVNERLRITRSISGFAAAWEWYIAEGRIVGDERFAALYGLTPEDAARGVESKTFFSIIHPEDQTRIRLAIGGMLRGAEVFSKEYRVLIGDGSMRWMHARGRCQYDEDERPTRFTGVLVDITDQKRAAEKLRIAQTAGGIGPFEYIDGFGTASVSEQFCRLLGLHPAQDLPVRTINALVHPDDKPIIDMSEPAGSGRGKSPGVPHHPARHRRGTLAHPEGRIPPRCRDCRTSLQRGDL